MTSASRAEKASGVEELAQIYAIYKFHEEKEQSVRPPEFVKCDDIGMLDHNPVIRSTGSGRRPPFTESCDAAAPISLRS